MKGEWMFTTLSVALSLFLQIINPGLQSIGSSGGISNGAPGPPPGCTGQPAWNASYRSTTITPGTLGPGSTITDSSGNSHTATIAVGAPVVGVVVTTPNGTQTIQMAADTYATLAGTAIANGGPVSIYAVYSLSAADDSKKTLTSSTAASGAYGYFPTGDDFAPQGMDVTSAFNVDKGTATPPLAPTWIITGVTYTPGSAPVFYRSNGAGVMVVDPLDGGGDHTDPSFNGIDIIFSNFNGGISEGFNGALAELDIIASATTSTQAQAVATCAVSRYGTM